jgi:hypothetical protein
MLPSLARLPDSLHALVVQPTIKFLLVYSKTWGQAYERSAEQAAEQQDYQHPGRVSG